MRRFAFRWVVPMVTGVVVYWIILRLALWVDYKLIGDDVHGAVTLAVIIAPVPVSVAALWFLVRWLYPEDRRPAQQRNR